MSPIGALIKKNQGRTFVLFTLVFAFFYHYVILPPEQAKEQKGEKENGVFLQKPDLNEEKKEVVYPQALRSQEGDVFRIGAFIKSEENENLEVLARSPLNELVSIGTWKVAPSEQGEYKEFLFFSPKRYEDIIIRLQDAELSDSTMKWNKATVFINSFAVTRIKMPEGATESSLMPTIFGASKIEKSFLVSEESSKDVSRWNFVANGDFLQALEFAGETAGDGNQEYTFQLLSSEREGDEGALKKLQNVSFTLDSLRGFLKASGNYEVPFFAPVKKGERYMLLLSKKDPKSDKRSFFTLDSLENVNTSSDYIKNSNLALHSGIRFSQNGATFPDGARLEDLGNGLFYSFSFQKKPVDYTNIFEKSDQITFNEKKHVVTGERKRGEFYTYKFDTIYPFEQLVIEAEQDGGALNELKLEYSFDNAFWKEISYSQEKGSSQKFLLVLPKSGENHEVYVRISYNGQEKDSGSFALKSFSVNASILRR